MGRAGISGWGRPSVRPAASSGNWKRFWAYCTNPLKRLASALRICQAFGAAQEFGVELGKFLHQLLEASEMGDACFGRLSLSGGLERKFVDLPHGQTLRQKIKRAVFGPVVMTVTVGLAAAGKAFHQ